MCGIGLLLSIADHSNRTENVDKWNGILSQALSNRGPDLPGQSCHYCFDGARLTLHGSVLHMRGVYPSIQPLQFSLAHSFNDDETMKLQSGLHKCALCWNGECYGYSKDQANEENHAYNDSPSGLSYSTVIDLVGNSNATQELAASRGNQSDTVLVKDLLSQSIADIRQSEKTTYGDRCHLEHKAVASTLARIHGEYAFILYVPSMSSTLNGYIYYGKDVLGRRSLLLNRCTDHKILLSSVACKSVKSEDESNINTFENSWEEIPPGIVYRMNVISGEVSSMAIPRIINVEVRTALSSILSAKEQAVDDASKQLLHILDKSVQRRVVNAPEPKSQNKSDASVAILFSGGIDSVVLAALSDRHIPQDRPIDLMNVSFHDNSDSSSSAISPDRLAAFCSYCEMTMKWPERKWRFIAVDVSYREVCEVEQKISTLISPSETAMDFNIAVAFWFAGRGKGSIVSCEEARELINGTKNQNATQLSQAEEPLLRYANVSASQNERHISKKRQHCAREGCDRPALANGCVFNVCKFCCGKLQSPICKFLGERVQICHAHDGAFKKSKKTAKQPQYFHKQVTPVSVTSAAKILISGVGADEQCAGYGRHRTTFQRGGCTELKDELKMEVERLWIRNLGRDDRCLSDCGKEARFPFLDEDVVAFLETLPLHLKCDLNLPQGEGDKLILRRVARLIGVLECSSLVKRAIQFGSRIAKVSDKNRFGSQRQASGEAKHKGNPTT